MDQIKHQAEIAIDEADVIIFVASGREGITDADELVAKILYRSNKPVILAVNKVDNPEMRNDIYEFYGVEKNFEIKKLFSPNIKFLKKKIYSFRCLNQVKKIKPDLVYGRDDIFAFYLTQKAGYKTIFERHDNFIDDKYRLDESIFKKFIKENVNNYKLITNTQKLKEYYCKEYNLKSEHIHVASSATDVPKDFDTIPDNCEKFRNTFNVGYIGKLAKMRGIEIIIKLAQNLPDMYFHIVGGNENE